MAAKRRQAQARQKNKHSIDPFAVGHAFRKAWENSEDKENLEIIVSGSEKSRDILSALISPYSRINHIIENSGIITFRTE